VFERKTVYATQTLREVALWTLGARTRSQHVSRIDATRYLNAFVEKLSPMNGGRAFFTTRRTMGTNGLVILRRSTGHQRRWRPCRPLTPNRRSNL